MSDSSPLHSAARRALGLASRLQLHALLVGGLVATVITWPLVLEPAQRLLGSPYLGAFSHVWKHWWCGQALGPLQQNPAFTTLLGHPRGLEVGFHLAGFFETLPTLPLTWAWGPVVGFNLSCLLNLATATWAMAWLAERLGFSRGVGLFVAVSWAFAPRELGFLLGGGVENLASPLIPLLVLALIGIAQASAGRGLPPGRGLRLGTLIAVLLPSMTLTCWYNGALLAACAGVFLVAVLLRYREGAFTPVAWGASGLGLGCVIVLAAASVFMPQPTELVGQTLRLHGGDLLAFWLDRPPPGGFVLSAPPMNNHVLVALLVPALLGLAHPRGRRWGLALTPFLVFGLLPDGSLSAVDLRPLSSTASGMRLAWLLSNGPRVLLPLHFILSIMAGYGLQWLVHRLRGAAVWVPGLALLLWVLESSASGPVPLPVHSARAPAPAWAHWLAQQDAEGAVLDLPPAASPDPSCWGAAKAIRSWYLFHQTIHGKPLVTMVGSRLDYSRFNVQDSLLQVAASVPIDRDPFGSADGPTLLAQPVRGASSWDALAEHVASGWSPRGLVEQDVRWLVLHGELVSPEHGQRFSSALERVLGAPQRFEDGTVIFELHD